MAPCPRRALSLCSLLHTLREGGTHTQEHTATPLQKKHHDPLVCVCVCVCLPLPLSFRFSLSLCPLLVSRDNPESTAKSSNNGPCWCLPSLFSFCSFLSLSLCVTRLFFVSRCEGALNVIPLFSSSARS